MTITRALVAPFIVLSVGCADPGRPVGGPGGPGGSGGGRPAGGSGGGSTPTGGLPERAWSPADGFVVHEWGTLTSVVGSDGVLLPGLHHEEEDLPPFVADRMLEARAYPDNARFAQHTHLQKMETPVTYFYAAEPRTVSARVRFPQGMLTQWYPWVRDMSPPVFDVHDAPVHESHDTSMTLFDRWSQTLQSIPERCRRTFSADHANGLLDWGAVEILARGQQIDLPGPIDRTTWGFARRTASNGLRVTPPGEAAQHEKFLFYRGIGDFDLPLRATASRAGVALENRAPSGAMGGLFLMRVEGGRAGWTELGDLPAGTRREAAPVTADRPLDEFVRTLRTRLAARLTEDGLYTDEAVAMVDTWERSYFLTPGTRLLYLLPQAETDRVIPLELSPPPARLSRTMVIRVELMTPEHEARLAAAAADLASGDPATRTGGASFFLGLGRFAEPSLARAIRLAPGAATSADVQALLDRVQARHRWDPITAE